MLRDCVSVYVHHIKALTGLDPVAMTHLIVTVNMLFLRPAYHKSRITSPNQMAELCPSTSRFTHRGQTKELSYGTLPLCPSSNESVMDNWRNVFLHHYPQWQQMTWWFPEDSASIAKWTTVFFLPKIFCVQRRKFIALDASWTLGTIFSWTILMPIFKKLGFQPPKIEFFPGGGPPDPTSLLRCKLQQL